MFRTSGGCPHWTLLGRPRFKQYSGITLQYGIVVEVGTSHTEATLYHWEGAKLGGTGRVDQVRRVESQQVGLAQTAAPGATSRDISGLLDSLKEFVPESQRPTTPIYLLATEGMRLNK